MGFRGRSVLLAVLGVMLLAGGLARPGNAARAPAEPFPQTEDDASPSAEAVPPAVCQQVRALHRWALRLTRLNPEQADALARTLGYAPDASANLMCVPLSLEVLRRARLLPAEVQPAAYWLLNPQQEPDKVARLFPPERFVHDLITGLPSRLDFRTHPLAPGDVLYLYSGSWGTFSHMLVVTYVDRAGRAYGLSNLNTPRGYIVREVLLYDPNRPGVGQLARWNDPRWGWLGLTGFGGVELWRPAAWARYAAALGRGACAEPPASGQWLWGATWAEATE